MNPLYATVAGSSTPSVGFLHPIRQAAFAAQLRRSARRHGPPAGHGARGDGTAGPCGRDEAGARTGPIGAAVRNRRDPRKERGGRGASALSDRRTVIDAYATIAYRCVMIGKARALLAFAKFQQRLPVFGTPRQPARRRTTCLASAWRAAVAFAAAAVRRLIVPRILLAALHGVRLVHVVHGIRSARRISRMSAAISFRPAFSPARSARYCVISDRPSDAITDIVTVVGPSCRRRITASAPLRAPLRHAGRFVLVQPLLIRHRDRGRLLLRR